MRTITEDHKAVWSYFQVTRQSVGTNNCWSHFPLKKGKEKGTGHSEPPGWCPNGPFGGFDLQGVWKEFSEKGNN